MDLLDKDSAQPRPHSPGRRVACSDENVNVLLGGLREAGVETRVQDTGEPALKRS